MSYADKVFRQNMEEILTHGVTDNDQEVRPKWADGTPAHTKKRFCLVNRYDLSKEFPIMTLRKQGFKNALDEILWIWQKKSNKVADLHSHIWDSWAGEDGTIGHSYGWVLAQKYAHHEVSPKDEHLKGEEFPSCEVRWVEEKQGFYMFLDQVDGVLWDLKHNPSSRRIMTNIYNFEELHNMNLYPCAYSMTFNVAGGKLNGLLNQRSNDMAVANNWNVIQYSLLLIMFAQVSGYEPGELVHVIADAHIYDRHISSVEEMLKNPEYPAPTLKINKKIKNFYDFTVDDFELVNYQATPLSKRLEVAV